MDISKNRLILLCVLLLVGLGGVVYRIQHNQQAEKAKQEQTRTTDANKNCRRASERTALAAAFIFAEAYDSPEGTSEVHNGYARGLILTLPVPKGHENDPTIAEVERLENSRRVVTYRLTPEAKALQIAGCNRYFPPGR